MFFLPTNFAQQFPVEALLWGAIVLMQVMLPVHLIRALRMIVMIKGISAQKLFRIGQVGQIYDDR